MQTVHTQSHVLIAALSGNGFATFTYDVHVSLTHCTGVVHISEHWSTQLFIDLWCTPAQTWIYLSSPLSSWAGNYWDVRYLLWFWILREDSLWCVMLRLTHAHSFQMFVFRFPSEQPSSFTTSRLILMAQTYLHVVRFWMSANLQWRLHIRIPIAFCYSEDRRILYVACTASY